MKIALVLEKWLQNMIFYYMYFLYKALLITSMALKRGYTAIIQRHKENTPNLQTLSFLSLKK